MTSQTGGNPATAGQKKLADHLLQMYCPGTSLKDIVEKENLKRAIGVMPSGMEPPLKRPIHTLPCHMNPPLTHPTTQSQHPQPPPHLLNQQLLYQQAMMRNMQLGQSHVGYPAPSPMPMMSLAQITMEKNPHTAPSMALPPVTQAGPSAAQLAQLQRHMMPQLQVSHLQVPQTINGYPTEYVIRMNQMAMLHQQALQKSQHQPIPRSTPQPIPAPPALQVHPQPTPSTQQRRSTIGPSTFTPQMLAQMPRLRRPSPHPQLAPTLHQLQPQLALPITSMIPPPSAPAALAPVSATPSTSTSSVHSPSAFTMPSGKGPDEPAYQSFLQNVRFLEQHYKQIQTMQVAQKCMQNLAKTSS